MYNHIFLLIILFRMLANRLLSISIVFAVVAMQPIATPAIASPPIPVALSNSAHQITVEDSYVDLLKMPANSEDSTFTKLIDSDGISKSLFGGAIDFDGNQAVVSAVGDNFIYIYNYVDDKWTKTAKISPPNLEDQGIIVSSFNSVAIDGNTIVAGASSTDINGYQDEGAAFIYQYDGSEWHMEAFLSKPLGSENPLLVEDSITSNYFGANVAIDGNTVVVTRPALDYYDSEFSDGSFFVYEYKNGIWQEEAGFDIPGNSGSRFVHNIALDGDRLLVGNYLYDFDYSWEENPGIVYIYEKTNGEWKLTSRVLPSDPFEDKGGRTGLGGQFGTSIALSGNNMLVSAKRSQSYDSTLVYLFTLENGKWVEKQKITNRIGVELNGTTAVAYNNEDITLYELKDGKLQEKHRVNNPTRTDSPYISRYRTIPLDIDGKNLYIGYPDETVNGNKEQGAVYILDTDIEGNKPPIATPTITKFMLVNARTDQDIMEIKDGDVLELSNLPRYQLNVRADVEGDLKSVQFTLNGEEIQPQNAAPYALFGDEAGDYDAGTFQVGTYALTAIPYSGSTATGTAGTALTVEFEIVQRNTIADIVKREEDFSILSAALTQVGYKSTLVKEGPFTVFAPTNAAFEATLASLGLTDVTQIPVATLREIIQYHLVVGQALRSSDLTDGQAIETRQYGTVEITINGSTIQVNDATIINADVMASNGVIHAINQVLMPPMEGMNVSAMNMEASPIPAPEK